MRDIDFSRAHANNAVRPSLASVLQASCQFKSCKIKSRISVLALHSSCKSGNLADRCVPQCTTQVIAVTCEDGSCSLWFWSQSKCVGNLELPPGGSCYFPHIRLCDQMLSPLLPAASKQRFLLLLGDTILICQHLLHCLMAAIHTPVVYTQITWKHLV